MIGKQGKRWLLLFYHWGQQICDPLRFLRGLRGVSWYLFDLYKYVRLLNGTPVHLLNTWPQLHDRTSSTGIDSHYFFVNGWAMRRIVAQDPIYHVDVGSQTILVNLLSAIVPVVFLDYRPLKVKLNGLNTLGADILRLPFDDVSIQSLSCLHVAEHIGLGRYGDPLNPFGTRDAAHELERVLAKGGDLFFALPVGRPRLCFNAHRIHAPRTVCDYFSTLELVEFSAVDDRGQFVERACLDDFIDNDYACGMYWFRKC